MKIAVESSVLIRSKKTGIDYYTEQLIGKTAQKMPKDEFYLCYLSFFTKKPIKIKFKSKNIKTFRNKLFPGKLYNFLFRYLYAPAYDSLFGLRADVMVYPNFIRFPLFGIKKSILFVHDTAYLDSPENLIEKHRRFLIKFVPRSIKKASRIVTISESTKRQLISHYQTEPEKIDVINPAVDHKQYFPVDKKNIEKVKSKYGIKGDYILYLGTIEPRKNIEGLLKAYDNLKDELKSSYKLVLAGGKGWLDDEIDKLVSELGDRVIRTGYVDDIDKPAIYSGAKIFVYPSHFEGWGMQILEAMSCGTPVISSDNSSLPEAAGNAGILVDSKDYISLSKIISKTIQDPKLLRAMSKAGIKHSKDFSWDKSAEAFKKVLENL